MVDGWLTCAPDLPWVCDDAGNSYNILDLMVIHDFDVICLDNWHPIYDISNSLKILDPFGLTWIWERSGFLKAHFGVVVKHSISFVFFWIEHLKTNTPLVTLDYMAWPYVSLFLSFHKKIIWWFYVYFLPNFMYKRSCWATFTAKIYTDYNLHKLYEWK